MADTRPMAPGMTARVAFLRSFAFSLLALALLVRAAVPAGWMPTGEKAFAITVCTGIETEQVWMTADGAIHKSDPSKKEHKQDGDGSAKGCAFAGVSLSALPALADAVVAVPVPVAAPVFAMPDAVGVGQGLAAPPPPSTGPPVLI